MNDLTLLYYTSNTMHETAAQNVRKHLERNFGQYPLVSVSQKPLNFGENICVGPIGQSYYNCYKQILIGAKAIKTKYVAMAEDDTLYNDDHFMHRPDPATFLFNTNMWYTESRKFWIKYKGETGMCCALVERDYLVSTLEPRFVMFPDQTVLTDRQQRWFQEPGRDDMKFGIPNANVSYFYTQTPILTFNYFAGLGGKKITKAHIPIELDSIEPWGEAKELHDRFWNRSDYEK